MLQGLAPDPVGILGLYLKKAAAEPELGSWLAGMIERPGGDFPQGFTMAVYGRPSGEGCVKVSLRHPDPAYDWERLAERLGRFRGCTPELQVRGNGAVISVRAVESAVRDYVRAQAPEVTLLGAGACVEIFEEGGGGDVAARVRGTAGSHALGHTGTARPAILATAEAELFAAGRDLCVVHEGALERPQRLRARLHREGFELRLERDASLVVAYLTWQMQLGATLAAAVEKGLSEFAGLDALTAATRGALVMAVKSRAAERLLLAEHEAYAAFAPSRTALSALPDIATARLERPRPGKIYEWTRGEDARGRAAEFVVLG